MYANFFEHFFFLQEINIGNERATLMIHIMYLI